MTTILIRKEGCYVDNRITCDNVIFNQCKLVKPKEECAIPLTSESYLKYYTITGSFNKLEDFMENKILVVLDNIDEKSCFSNLYNLITVSLDLGLETDTLLNEGKVILFGGELGSEKITTIVVVNLTNVGVYIVSKQTDTMRLLFGENFFKTDKLKIGSEELSPINPEYLFEINSRLKETGTSSSYDFFNFEDCTITRHDSTPETKKLVDQMFINELKIGQGE